jgi:hypothetical protein
MITLENTEIFGWKPAIRGMRNPMNSWDQSDSHYNNNLEFIIGENDLALMRKLVKAGSDHRKFLRQIFVSVDITAPLYWWKEYDTYKVGTTANSCSTMHKIHAKEFTREDFSCEHLLNKERDILDTIIEVLNEDRLCFINTKDKTYWHQMIQLLPSSYNQKRTCTMTYENLFNMYFARRYHKLDEWHIFCEWAKLLPNFSKVCLCSDANVEGC